ncbi:Zinc finger protein ZAT5 [Spatholobus suberectus]|nr:Zinc finger protein ZAT5 [Spatholobus suberectus]
MEMEGLDSNNSTHNIAKGKRTKRMRLLSPCGVAATTTTTTTVMITSSCSSANSGDSSTTTYESEEEAMANCLILLAQGGESHPHHHKQHVEDHGLDNCDGNKTEKGITTTATTAVNTTKVGFYIYECKTCNRTFPSFQALGGHRASHKKPKLAAEEKKPPPSQLTHMIISNYGRFEEANYVKSGPPISLQLGHGNNKKGKIHECSICGSEFTSGQALGGHMRRHRASTNANTADTTSCTTVTPRPRNILQLDLNLPAPEDDVREAKFQFAATQVLVGTPALVDCHY